MADDRLQVVKLRRPIEQLVDLVDTGDDLGDIASAARSLDDLKINTADLFDRLDDLFDAGPVAVAAVEDAAGAALI